MPLVVVGIDWSRGAEAASEFALEEALLRHAELRVVCAWEGAADGVRARIRRGRPRASAREDGACDC
jgi:nucleotide-binding universal stress UspA family protein